jgi:hypothetical protein
VSSSSSSSSSSSLSQSSREPAVVRLVEPVSPSELAAGTPIIVCAFETGVQFLDAFAESRGPAGELAVRTRASPPPGTPMVLEITWHGLPNRVFARAIALRRWLGGHLVLQLDPDEREKRDYLLAVARGSKMDTCTRAHRRFVVRLPLFWRRFGDVQLHEGIAEDLSSGGLLVCAQGPGPIASDRVAVRLRAEAAYQELVLTGEVRHTRPRAGDRSAFGVELKYRSSAQQRTLRSLLRAFAGRGVVLVDPNCQ